MILTLYDRGDREALSRVTIDTLLDEIRMSRKWVNPNKMFIKLLSKLLADLMMKPTSESTLKSI